MRKALSCFVGVVIGVGGLVSNANAVPLTQGNLVVSQVGDGTAALSGVATATFLREFTVAGSPVQSIALPTSTIGANRMLTNSGSATSEIFLTRSVDGNFLLLGGYDAALGTAGVATSVSATVNRVVGRVALDGTIDTTTALTDAYSGGNIRSVASTNGLDLWLGGTSGTSGSVRYTTLGGTTTTQLSTTITNTRVVNIFNSQLYTSSATGAFQGVSSVGTGTPTSIGQTITLLPGFPTAAGPSAYDFYFADPNTLYVADDRATASGGGLQKWTLSGGTWSLAYTLNVSLGAAGLRGLTAVTDGSGVTTLYATTAEAITATAGNRLVTVTDLGAASAFVTLATSEGNRAFRGVEFSPIPEPGTLVLLALAVGVLAKRRRLNRADD